MTQSDGPITWKKLLILLGLTIGLCVTTAYALSKDKVSVLAFDLLRGDIKRIEAKVDKISDRVGVPEE